MWKLSIKGSRVPWTGVDSGQDALALFTALPRYCRLTSGSFSVPPFPESILVVWGGEDKGFQRWLRCEMLSGTWMEGGITETQIRATCLHTGMGCQPLLRHRPLWVMPLTSQYPAGHSIMTSCASGHQSREEKEDKVEREEMAQSPV